MLQTGVRGRNPDGGIYLPYNKIQAEHCRQRLWQRFRLTLPAWRIQKEIKDKIRAGKCLKIRKHSSTQNGSIYSMVYHGELIKAVYNPETATVVTVLP